MVTKLLLKEIAIKAGIPVIEDSKEHLTSEKIAISEAKRIGYPVMIKAASGGGGRGMRVVRTKKNLLKVFTRHVMRL